MNKPAKKKSSVLCSLLMVTMFGPTAFGKSSVIVDQTAAMKTKIAVIQGMNGSLYTAAQHCAKYPDKMKSQIVDPASTVLSQALNMLNSLQNIAQTSGCDPAKMKTIVANNVKTIDSIVADLTTQAQSFAKSDWLLGQAEKNILEGLEWDKRYPRCGHPTMGDNPHSNNETLNFVVWKKSLFCQGLLDKNVLGEASAKPTSDCLINWLKTLKSGLLKPAGPSELAPSCGT